MNNIKLGFIGCGRHAKANIYPSIKLLGYQLLSVCARHIDRAQATAKEFLIPNAYDNYLRMLEKDKPDAVFVITGEQHDKIVEDCLKAGAHVFVEKPLGWNATEAKRIADLSNTTGKTVMVGFMKRFAPAYVELKHIAEEEETFGKILSMTGMFAIGARGKSDEMFLKRTAIHFIDLIRFLFGEVKEIHALNNSYNEFIDQVFCFSTQDGRIGNMFFAGLPSWERHYEEIIVTGVKGFVKVENLARVISHLATKTESIIPRWQQMDEIEHVLTSVNTSSSGGWQDLYLNGYVDEIKHFFDCITRSTVPSNSAEDNVKTMALCDTILKSLNQV